jgi:hypothetical protein
MLGPMIAEWRTLLLRLQVPACLTAALLAGALGSRGVAAAAGTDAFAFDRSRISRGTVLVYKETNIGFDEQMALETVFVDDQGNLHVLKLLHNEPKPLLVEADFDWGLFSAVHFRAWDLPRDRGQAPKAVGDYDPGSGEFRIRAATAMKTIKVSGAPFHVHDFELLSLGHAMRFLKSLESSFTFDLIGMSDDPHEPIFYKDSGNVTVRYERDLRYADGTRVAEYSMVHTATGKYFGRLELDRGSRDLLLVETPEPDEPGILSLRLQLIRRSHSTPAAWDKALAAAAGK